MLAVFEDREQELKAQYDFMFEQERENAGLLMFVCFVSEEPCGLVSLRAYGEVREGKARYVRGLSVGVWFLVLSVS